MKPTANIVSNNLCAMQKSATCQQYPKFPRKEYGCSSAANPDNGIIDKDPPSLALTRARVQP